MRQDFNLHTHTSRCGHAFGTDEEYVLAAIQAGYRVLGFSDHSPYRDYPRAINHMDWSQLGDYIDSVLYLKEKYRDQIEIHLGMESEYYSYTVDEKWELRGMLEYMILGQHFLHPSGEGSFFRNCSDEDILEYARGVCAGMETGMFSYVCHPDVFLNKQTRFTDACGQAAHMIGKKAEETGLPLEVNIRGIFKGLKEFDNGLRYWYPNYDFWQILSQYDIKCVVGIDAHNPQDLLRLDCIDRAYEELAGLNLQFVDSIEFR